jgi:hypothetical protein
MFEVQKANVGHEMNETLDGVLGMERLEDLEEHLESILQKRTPIVNTELIGLIASKRNFDPIKD